jgi:DNA recombination protein RmuC
MNSDLLIISSILIIGFIILAYLINKRSKQTPDNTLLEWLKSMQQSMDANTKTVNSTLQSHSNALNERLDNAARVIAGVQKNIGEMSEIGRSMKELQEFLTSPKLRGNIGEQILKELLAQMLPKKTFKLQYAFKSGSIVDAIIITESGIIPIDSKFPMENFKKMNNNQLDDKKNTEKDFVSDVKKHIDAISKKYIVPDEGTIDFALMYIPSESVYYEIVNHASLYDYATERRVLPTSPMTFYAYLRTILMGFEGQRITAQAKEILSGIRGIQKEYEKVGENLDTLTKHVTNSYNMAGIVQTGFSKLGSQIAATHKIEKEEKLLEN